MTANSYVIHEQQTTVVAIDSCVRGMPAFLLILSALAGNVALADSYANLPETDKNYVRRVCSPIQYQQDTSAYRNCVEQHSEALQQSIRTPVSSLDFDEQLSVQQVCQKQGAIGSTDYRSCVVTEASSLDGVFTADISSLNNEQIYSARQSCADAEYGVRAYRQCINTAVAKLKAPAIATVELPAVALATQEIEPAAVIESAAVVEPAAVIEPAAIVEPAAVVEPVAVAEPVTVAESVAVVEPNISELASTANDTIAVDRSSIELQNNSASTLSAPVTPVALRSTTVANEDPVEKLAIVESTVASIQIAQAPVETNDLEQTSKPALAAAESDNTNNPPADQDTQEPANSDELDPVVTNKPPLEVAKGLAQKLWAQLLASLEGVTGINKIILLAALALPFFLIGFWLLMRSRTDKSEPATQPNSRPLVDKIRATPNHLLDDETTDVSSDVLNAQKMQFSDQVSELFADDDDPVFADIEAPEFDGLDSPETVDESSTLHVVRTPEKPDKPIRSCELSAILEDHDDDDQLGLVIEFMIYWMAFTDERFQPELKRKIFAETEPDDHDLIKRCVLSNDFGAFTAATTWLQKNAAIEKREQVLKLLMALLVYEEGITPVQNTMLRFLSNAFGFTHQQLDELFQTAFGHALPAMPRPDKPTWWNKQSPDKLKRWDARSVAQQSQSIQARVKLGLPLSGELTPQEISERLERAVSRCQPENFDLLTHREQQLAESQKVKYKDAAEALMEISV